MGGDAASDVFLACSNAICDCTELLIFLIPGNEENPTLEDAVLKFSVDVEGKKLASKDEGNEPAREITRQFDMQDWQFLLQVFLDLKRKQTNLASADPARNIKNAAPSMALPRLSFDVFLSSMLLRM